MCKFCEVKDKEGRCETFSLDIHRNIPKSDSIFFDGCSMIGTFLKIIKRGSEGAFLSSDLPYFDREQDLKGYGKAEIKIEFCPFCGRKLDE